MIEKQRKRFFPEELGSETFPPERALGVAGKEWLGQPVMADLSIRFNIEYLPFIFEYLH